MNESIQTVDKKKVRRIFVALFICLLVFIGVVWYVSQKKAEREAQQRLNTQSHQPTKEEILQSLSAPATSPPVSEVEKQKILKTLSVPAKTKSSVTPQQKEDILKSLSAPSSQ